MAPLVNHESKIIKLTIASILLIILLLVSIWLVKFNLKWNMTDKPIKPIMPLVIPPNTSNQKLVVPLFIDETGKPCNDC